MAPARVPAIDELVEHVERDAAHAMRADPVVLLASCEDCGTVRLPAVSCALLHCRDTDDFRVAFACPNCGRRSVSDCGRTRVTELVSAGVVIDEWHYPDELDDPVRTNTTPADRDALLDLLADGSWLEALDGHV